MARSIVRWCRLWTKVTIAVCILFIVLVNINVHGTISDKFTSLRRLTFMYDSNSTRSSSILSLLSLGKTGQIDRIHRNVWALDQLVSDKWNTLQNKSGGRIADPNQSVKSHPINKKSSEQTVSEDFRRKHLMTVNGNGRLGNQIFQVATLLGVAEMHGYTPFISPNHKITSIFDVNIVKRINLKNVKRVGEVKAGAYDSRIEKLSHDTNWTLRGYYQSWRYFDHISSQVRKSLKFKDYIIHDANKCLKPNNSPHIIKVGIHVRRSDMNSMRELNRGYNVANEQYLSKALDYFRTKFKTLLFIAVSDDMGWVRRNVKGDDVMYCTTSSAPADLAVLSMCNHNIVTSGTFGWWGAYLAGGITVYYDKYPKPGSWLDKQYNRTEYYPRSWIGMS